MTLLQSIGDLFRMVRFSDIIDMAIIAFVIYIVLRFLLRMGSGRVLLGAIFLVAAAYGLAESANLRVLKFILGKTTEIGLLALLIVFQPEIHRMLDRVGGKVGWVARMFRSHSDPQAMEAAIDHVVDACRELSETRTGALIIFERINQLDDYFVPEKKFDAEPQKELLKTVFYTGTSLHDGALIIRDGRIVCAGCTMPTTTQKNLSPELGTRHQAGIGISEVTDAVAVIVSEETGTISMTMEGRILRHLTAETLRSRLKSALLRDENEQERSKLRNWFTGLFTKDRNDGE